MVVGTGVGGSGLAVVVPSSGTIQTPVSALQILQLSHLFVQSFPYLPRGQAAVANEHKVITKGATSTL